MTDLESAAREDTWDVVIDNIAYNGDHVQAALKAFSKVRHYILTSTVSVYRYVPHPFSQPAQRDLGRFRFSSARRRSFERTLEVCSRKTGCRGSLCSPEQCPLDDPFDRPSFTAPTISPTAAFGMWVRLSKGGPLLLPNGGMNSLRLAYSRDLAQSYLLAAEHPEAMGSIYNIAQEEIITLRDFIEENARILNVRPELVSLPFEAAKELGGPYAYTGNWIPDIELAKRDLDFTPDAVFGSLPRSPQTGSEITGEGMRQNFLRTETTSSS